MEFSTIVKKRRMVRDFDPQPIPADTIQQILAHAQRGPSSGFTQGFEFLVFDGPEHTQRFWVAVPWWDDPRWEGARQAPLVIVPFAHEAAYVARYLASDKVSVGRLTGADFPAPYWFIDTAFAAMLTLLSSIDAGLGAFYFSIAETSKEIPIFCQSLNIPDGYYPIGAIAIGYPSKNDQPVPPSEVRKHRRAPTALIHLNTW